ncbi:hypothetical protein DFJ58DRAFT_726234 [Suillus subalutaceus]|uniref:uncharacterized protein n=1 Tax=Suillus subalutaceus TaxID=48586 RepID=UPI001B86825B|nr:uncharacterized protein DFJ58DRAFT_726234 [Suillus subalutaceus]KAG1860228.1 hypothetical protein DFJ58DRAFT_726234 [Suillus subalutaceus]
MSLSHHIAPFVPSLSANMPYFYRTIDNGIKLALLMSIPINDVATLNKMTTIELDRLVTTEPQSLANGSLGHLLPLIFKPFTINIPQVHSFTHRYRKLRVLLYDYAGGAVTPRIKIYQHPDTFAQIIAAVVFSSPECISTDIPGYHPFKNLPAQATQSITIPAEHDSESLAALLGDPQELPHNNGAGSIFPSDNPLEPIPLANDTLEMTTQ